MSTTRQGDEAQSPSESKNPVKEPLDQVKQEGQRLASQAKEGVKHASEEQKDNATHFMKSVVAAVDSSARELDARGHAVSASLVSSVASDFGDFVDRLTERPTGELLQEVEDFARQRPALFFGAALLAGFGGARFLKSSASDRADASQGGPPHEERRSAP